MTHLITTARSRCRIGRLCRGLTRCTNRRFQPKNYINKTQTKGDPFSVPRKPIPTLRIGTIFQVCWSFKIKKHLDIVCGVEMNVEYRGGRTFPRIPISNFDGQVLYYSDFCYRFEDQFESKLTQVIEEANHQVPNTLQTKSEEQDTENYKTHIIRVIKEL